MTQRYFLALIFSTLLTFGLNSCGEQAALPGKPFEGTITQVIKLPGIAKGIAGSEAGQGSALLSAMSNVNLKIYASEGKVAYEFAVMGGLMKMKTIIDRNTRTMTVLTPDKKAVVMDLRSMDSMRRVLDDSINNSDQLDSLADMLPRPTGNRKEINGFEVEEYVGKMNGMDVQMWLTSDPRMQFYEVLRDAVLGRQRTGLGGVEEFFAMIMPFTKGKVPVQFTAKLDGEVFASSELTKLEETELDPEIFAIPNGYQVIKGDPNEQQKSSIKIDTSISDDADTTTTFITGKP